MDGVAGIEPRGSAAGRRERKWWRQRDWHERRRQLLWLGTVGRDECGERERERPDMVMWNMMMW